MKPVFPLALAIVLATDSLPAQTSPDQQPTFRTGVDMVAVDVSVVDEDGEQVDDLGIDDFVLEVDGEPRRIVSVEYVSRGGTPNEPRGASARTHFSTNEGMEPGRLIMIVIDQAHIRKGQARPAASAAARFLDTLNPTDRVALAVIPGMGPRTGFTANHALIKDALEHVVGAEDRFMGRFEFSLMEALAVERNDVFTWERAVVRECGGEPACAEFLAMEAHQLLADLRHQTAQSLGALRAIIDDLERIDEPKSLMYLSEGLLTEDGLADLAWLPEKAARAQVSLYAVHLDSHFGDVTDARPAETAAEDHQLLRTGLESMAGLARGALFRVIGTADVVFTRIARELSGEYLLTFEPIVGDRDGRSHDIDLDVRRPGVTVRARTEFRVGPTPMRNLNPTDEELLAEVLRSPFVSTGIPLRVASYTVTDATSGRLKTIVVSEIDKEVVGPKDLTIQIVMLDDRGRLAGSIVDRPTLHPLDADRPSPLQYTTSILADPGSYTLKFAVLDQTDGRRGSVDHPIQARLTRAADFQLADLMLAELVGGPEATLRPRVDLDLGADRLATYLEVYSARSDLLSRARVDFDIVPQGQETALVTESATLEETADPRRRTVEAMVPVELLPPGAYTAHARLSVDGRRLGEVTRPFRVATRGSHAWRATGTALPQRFERDALLGAPVLSAFLDRMTVAQDLPDGLRAATSQLREGRHGEVALDPGGADHPVGAFVRGVSRFAAGDLEGAAADFRATLQVMPDSAAALVYLGACYAAGGRDREAVGAWKMSLVHDTESPVVYAVLADALSRLEERDEAVEILTEAQEAFPDSRLFGPRLALAYLGASREADAYRTIGAHLERHPDDQDGLFLAARLIYEALSAGRSVTNEDEDRLALRQHARAYIAGGGPERAVVEQWLEYLDLR